jgi:2,3-bisphosphoglycerate-independent phosphoglycerate mutase
VKFHAFLDGRDATPQSALGYVEEFIYTCSNLPQFEFATIGGLYYGMDRDHRW